MLAVASLVLSFVAVGAAGARIDERNFSKDKIITRDVAIIGGGASGTYAAVRLREDLNTTIIVIEPQDRLGGHVQTYLVPESNTTVEYGVQSYIPYGGAENFFDRFGVQKIPFAPRRLTAINVDLTTSKSLTAYTPPASAATTESFNKWLQIVEKYEKLVEPGYWDYPLPENIPEDLLTPFGEFAKKNGLEAAVPRIMAISNVGVGGIKSTLTQYVIKAFGAPITRSVAAGSLFGPVGSNSLLYQKAYDLLKEDVLLHSYVQEAERSNSGVRLVVQNKEGKWLIKAKRILFTPPPSLDILKPFDVDKREKEVFKTWTDTWSFIGVAKIPCIPENYSINYFSPAAVPADHTAIRDANFTLRFDSTGPTGLGLFRILFATNYTITEKEAKIGIARKVQDLVTAGTLNYTGECKTEYRAFADHNSVLWKQTREQLKSGFVQKLNALQGHRSTWYTGGLWCSDYSSNVWVFTDTVLPKLLKGLKDSI